MASIGDIFISLMLDDVRFQREVVKAGAKGGDAAGKAMGEKMGMRLRNAVATGLGAAVGGIVGTASRLGAELNAATASFQAEVGATAEDTAKAQKTIGDLYRTNIISFQQASDTLAALRTDLGLTQDEADAAAESFVEFANVTRQDSTEAVRALDDILDNWGLTAANAQEIMDKLVVSHQKFGGVIADNEKTLAKLAPSMRAANFTIDDGIALLGLFGAKGLDSERAAAAFSKALSKVKSPRELQLLIDDISATEDPFLRAQKAADLFGVKAGAQLANALGGVDFRSYTIGAEEAAGATEKASDTLKSAFGTQVQLAIRNVGGALAEMAQNLGPAILGISMLGDTRFGAKLGAGIGAIFGNLGGRIAGGLAKSLKSSAIVQAISGPLGRAVGLGLDKATSSVTAIRAATSGFGRLGKVAGIAFKAAFLLATAAMLAEQVQAAQDDVSLLNETTRLAESGKATLEQLQAARERIAANLEREKGFFNPLEDFFGLSQQNNLQAQLDALDSIIAAKLAEMEGTAAAGGEGIGDAAVDGLADGIDPAAVEAATAALTAAVEDDLDGLPGWTKELGGEVAASLGQGILDAQDDVKNAVEAARHQSETEMTKMAEVAYLIGVITSQELAQGLRDERPGVVAAWRNTRETALERLRGLDVDMGDIGEDAGKALANGLESTNVTIRDNAESAQKILTGELDDGIPQALIDGQTYGQTLADGLRDKGQEVSRAASYLLSRASKAFRQGSAGGLVITLAPVRTSSDTKGGRQSGGPVSVGSAYPVGEAGRELFVPKVPGMIIPHAETEAMLAGSAAGNTYNVNMTGLIRARDPFEVATQLRRLSDFGVLTPRREPA